LSESREDIEESENREVLESAVHNIGRFFMLFINDSDYAQYLKFGADAVLNESIRLNANGGSYEISASAGNLYTGAVNVIAATAGTLLVTEGA
jgi:hypothetical protein